VKFPSVTEFSFQLPLVNALTLNFPKYSEGELKNYAHEGNKVVDMEADIGGLKLNKQQLENIILRVGLILI
jgi:hypothetical protein